MVVDGSPTSAQKDDSNPYPIFPTSLGHKDLLPTTIQTPERQNHNPILKSLLFSPRSSGQPTSVRFFGPPICVPKMATSLLFLSHIFCSHEITF